MLIHVTIEYEVVSLYSSRKYTKKIFIIKKITVMDLFSSMNFESNTSQQTISISVAIQTHIAIFYILIML